MSDIVINTSTTGNQERPTVADLFGTHYLVCWSDNNDGTIKGRAFRPTEPPSRPNSSSTEPPRAR
ncbi:MAG TPA: hypothetical protein DEQ61_09985 [Streptomyces sp.]|nr:hypothetical protein [Streptomyces sp.]